MSRLREEWHVGQPVWTKFRDIEWRPAVITKLGYKLIEVFFNSGRKSYGKRLAENLRPRDPALKGKDKPEPLEEK